MIKRNAKAGGNRKVVRLKTEGDRIAALKNYIKILEGRNGPTVTVTRATIFRDGFLPGWVLVRIFKMAGEKENRQNRRPLWARAWKAFCPKSQAITREEKWA